MWSQLSRCEVLLFFQLYTIQFFVNYFQLPTKVPHLYCGHVCVDYGITYLLAGILFIYYFAQINAGAFHLLFLVSTRLHSTTSRWLHLISFCFWTSSLPITDPSLTLLPSSASPFWSRSSGFRAVGSVILGLLVQFRLILTPCPNALINNKTPTFFSPVAHGHMDICVSVCELLNMRPCTVPSYVSWDKGTIWMQSINQYLE